MSRGAEIVLLCEDQQTSAFVGRLLNDLGYDRRAIRVEKAPSARNGEQFVRENYPKWVRFFRSRGATKALVAVVDADPKNTVARRHQQLAGLLKEAGQDPRGDAEPIVELVPKRNIETWIHALDPLLAPSLARPLDEVKQYAKLDYESDCAAAASELARCVATEVRPAAAAAILSLDDGLNELRRLP